MRQSYTCENGQAAVVPVHLTWTDASCTQTHGKTQRGAVVLYASARLWSWPGCCCRKGFVAMFTLGNIAALAATCFIVGPARQWRNMVTRERIASASAFVGSMLLTLFACAYVRAPARLCCEMHASLRCKRKHCAPAAVKKRAQSHNARPACAHTVLPWLICSQWQRIGLMPICDDGSNWRTVA